LPISSFVARRQRHKNRVHPPDSGETNWSFALRRTAGSRRDELLVRAGLTRKSLLSISRSRSGHSSRRGFDRAKTGPAKLLLHSDRIKKGRTPRY